MHRQDYTSIELAADTAVAEILEEYKYTLGALFLALNDEGYNFFDSPGLQGCQEQIKEMQDLLATLPHSSLIEGMRKQAFSPSGHESCPGELKAWLAQQN